MVVFTSCFIVIFIFPIWLVALLVVFKVRARQYDGYTVLVYVGFNKFCLIVEDVVQDSGSSFGRRFLYGQLPNKRQVWAAISARGNSVMMDVGQVGDEKNLI